MGGVHEDAGKTGAVVEAMVKEILIFVTGWLLIIAFSVIVLSPRVIMGEVTEETLCRFPCRFQGPVYHHPAVSAKYEYLKTIK